ncbi:hypothetical protein [Leptospira koniambonensis]|uniref:hypothetical protein n=1 Tax=Leptospira koniambonensis TaxID=2484950 RepID=UPI003EB77B6E
MKKLAVFILFLLGCSAPEIAVTPSLPRNAQAGTLRIIVEDKSGQKYDELKIGRFSLAVGQASEETIGIESLSSVKIPIGNNGISLRIPQGNYTGNILIWDADSLDRIFLKVLFNKDTVNQCTMNFLDDGWFLNDEYTCGPLKIPANKETVLKITITDRYDSRLAGSLVFALFTLGIIYPPAEIRHVDASLINPK